MTGTQGAGLKVYWKNPDGTRNVNHDDEVRATIEKAQQFLDERSIQVGLGVIDFADCTVIVASKTVPPREVFVTDRTNENSILHGGFGDNPFSR